MEELKKELKELIIEALNLDEINADDIKDEEPLFNEGLGLDSIDALEIGMAIKRKYNVVLGTDKAKNKEYFYSINTLADFVKGFISGK